MTTATFRRLPVPNFRSPRNAGDVVVVVLAVTLVVMIAVTPDRDIGDQVPRDFDLLAAGLAIAAAGALLLSFRAAVLGVIASFSLNAVWHLLGYTSGLIKASTVIAYYVVGTTGDRVRQVVACAGTAVAVTGLSVHFDAPVRSMYDAVGWPIAAVLLGEAVRARREHTQSLVQAAANAEQQRYRELERRATEERMQIARDLHDTLAHTIGVMTVQAGALQRVVASDPQRAAEVADVIRRIGKDAMLEVKATLNVLRSRGGTEALAPAPGLGDLDQLVATARTAGLDVECRVGDVDVPAVVGVTVYRIVQEAITNVARHSGSSRCTVLVTRGRGGLDVVITDPGPGRTPRPAGGSGHGLIGMRERIEAVGGTVTAGPATDGGFRVAAWLPLDGE